MTETKAVYTVNGQTLEGRVQSIEATIASLRADLAAAKRERDAYAEAGMEAAMVASNALNREAVLLAMLGQRDAEIERLNRALDLRKGVG